MMLLTADGLSLDFNQITKFDAGLYSTRLNGDEGVKKSLCLDGYLIEDVDLIDQQIDVDFFSSLPTPGEEGKPFITGGDMNTQQQQQLFGNNNNTNVTLDHQQNQQQQPQLNEADVTNANNLLIMAEAATSLMLDNSSMSMEDTFNDVSQYVPTSPRTTPRPSMSTLRLPRPNTALDSLQTPIIDPQHVNQALFPMITTPTLPSPSDGPFLCGSPDDICGQAISLGNQVTSIAPAPMIYHSTTTTAPTTTTIFSQEVPSYQSLEYPVVKAEDPVINYQPSTSSNFKLPISFTDFTSPSTSTSAVYTELKPRSWSEPVIPSMVQENADTFIPTVIMDHDYQTRTSMGSPAPSTSSLAESEIETKFSVQSDTSDSRPKPYQRKKNNESSKKSRQTKREKFVDMQRRQHELEHENQSLRNQADHLEKATKRLKEYLMEIMRNGGPKK